MLDMTAKAMPFDCHQAASGFAGQTGEWAQGCNAPLQPSSSDALSHHVLLLTQRVSGDTRERLAGFCMRWLAGGDARLRRAAAQTLGLLAGVEGLRVGRRVPALLPHLARVLRAHAGAAQGGAAGWQDAYYGLLLAEKLFAAAPAQVPRKRMCCQEQLLHLFQKC